MARVIVQALYGMPQLPEEDHPQVVKRATRGTVKSLTDQHELACKVLDKVKEITLPVDAPCPGIGWAIKSGTSLLNVWVRS